MISIVIPTVTGREKSYQRCVAAYKATTPVPFELITVRNERACGIAWGIGASQAKGDYLHFTADDLEPHAGWAEAAIEAVDRGVMPAANVLNPEITLVCPCPLEPRMRDVPNVLVPFFNRPLWGHGRWVVPIHYGSDDWITYLARRRDIPVEFVGGYKFSHSADPEGRLWMNRQRDVPDLASFMEAEGYVPKVYGNLATEFGWAGVGRMIVGTDVKLAEWRARARERADEFTLQLMDEIEYLTGLVTTVQAQRMFDRYQAFSGIRDDCCPACGGRVRIDENDPARLRIIADSRVRAS